MVLSLIKSYGLMSRLEVLPARAATFEELNSFHSSDFLNHLRVTTDSSDRETGDKNFGLCKKSWKSPNVNGTSTKKLLTKSLDIEKMQFG